MAQLKPLPLTDQLSFAPQGPNKSLFECVHPPQKVGNTLNIAYGGYALATACKAACLSVPEDYHLYSLLGHYLGPAFADRPLRADVRTIRQTRTFATRQVEVSQARDDGEPRICLIAIADYQTKEPATLLEYSKPPKMKYSPYQNLPEQHEVHQKLLQDGKVTQDMINTHAQFFSLLPQLFEMRPCPESIFSQNLFGIAKTLPTTQDHLPITDRTTAEWLRSRHPLSSSSAKHSSANNLATLSFLIDGAISFAPLSFNHMWFDDVSAQSSLDFSLRVFGAVDLEKWCLREISTSVGAEGRTYGESWVWDEEGRAVACMSQVGILRPRQEGKGKL